MIRITKPLAALVLSAVVFASLVAATCGDTTTRVENSTAQPRGISVSGQGKATGKPDVARITLGVTRLAPSVQEARDGAAASLDAIIASVQKNGVSRDDVQTQQFSISPEYDYSRGRQQLTGFRVTNTVSVKLRDINRTSSVVDDAVTAGGNDTQVQGIIFTIDKPDDLQSQAREAAIADARARADVLAKSAGVTLGKPTLISENGGPQPVVYDRALLGAGAESAPQPATPIEPGTLDVVIDVSVTWEID